MDIRKVQKIHYRGDDIILPAEIEVDLHQLANMRMYMDPEDLIVYLFRKSLYKYLYDREEKK